MNSRMFQRGGIIVLLSVAMLVFPGCPVPEETFNLEDAIVGTWTDLRGETITFLANGTYETSEGVSGAYQIVDRSVVFDWDDVEGELNYVSTYLGTLPDGRLLFSGGTPYTYAPADL